MNPNIEKYRLRLDDGSDVKPGSRLWQTQGIYLSDVCLAVKLSPRSGIHASEQELRDDLQTLLRLIGQEAMDHNLLRPVAGFIAGGPDAKTIATWAADQDWHRGAFTLYAESGENSPRLEALLDPQPEIFKEPPHQRTAKEILDAVEKRWNEDPDPAASASVFQTILGRVRDYDQSERKPDDVKAALSAWATEYRNDIEGRAP